MTDEKMIYAGRRYKRELEVDVFTAAQARMDYIYEHFDIPVISWSGGKDSTSVLELARMSAAKLGKLPVHVFFLDEEVIYPETLELVERHRIDPDIKFYWVCIPSLYRNACSEVEPDFIVFDPTKRALWTREPPPYAIWPAGMDKNGNPNMTNWRVPPSIPKRAIIEMFVKPNKGKSVISIMGLRTTESFVRHSGIMSSGSFISKPEHGLWGGRPIYDWNSRDVWLAFKTYGWDYNKAYDKLWRLGVSVNNARVAPLFHAEAAMQLGLVKKGWPKLWPKIRARVRGAQAVANNGGQLHKVERLEGETWKEAALRYWRSMKSDIDRKEIEKHVMGRLDDHAHHSSQPIHDDIPCPKCRVTWKLIARAISRGDRQDRMMKTNQAMIYVNPIIIEEDYEDEQEENRD